MLPVYYTENKTVRPVILVRDVVFFPNQVVHFDIESDVQDSAIEYALQNKKRVLLLTLKDPSIEKPTLDDFSIFGTIVEIKQAFTLPNGMKKLLGEGIERGKLEKVVREKPFLEAETIDYIYDSSKVEKNERLNLLTRLVSNDAVNFFGRNGQVPEIFLFPLMDESDPGKLADSVAEHLSLKTDEVFEILGELDVEKRLELVQHGLDLEESMSELSKELNDKAAERMNQSQKEYMLREQMSIIREELGDSSQDPMSVEEDYRERIEEMSMPDDIKEELIKEVDRMSYMSPMSPEVNVSRNYLDTVLELPWGVYTKDNLNIERSRKILEKHHYGLKDVKERILEFIAVRQLRNDSKGSILCLVGPPGVGKTSIARSIAEAIGREFTSMRLGGVTDESEIRGHRKTYVGSMPGRIITQMTKCKSMNPVFLFDEVDKIGSDFRGDPASALLEVLDPEQNSSFQDRYLEIAFDLSQAMFITTANTTDTIPGPLLDRMEVIEITGYTDDEKYEIAKRFLVPKKRSESGLTAKQFSITNGVLTEIINEYTREAGVRELERQIGKVARRAAKKIVEGEETVKVKINNLTDFLGEAKYFDDIISKKPEIGIVYGLAWTQAGGDILHIEANDMPGNGGIQLTGSLGDVMKESAVTSISYIRANADRYGIAPNFYATKDIHIHLPEGAVPKDGPSAGVSIATAVVSSLTNRPVRNDIAMTGEVTLTGKVLAIGGVKEKVLAAKRNGINTILLPKENLRDLKEMDQKVIKTMKFIPLESLDDVIRISLLAPVQPQPTIIFEAENSSKAIGFHYSKNGNAETENFEITGENL